MASLIGLGAAAAALSLIATGSALACPDVAACGGMSRSYGYYTEQASFGPMVDGQADAYGYGYGGEPPYGADPYSDQDSYAYGAPPTAGGPAQFDEPYADTGEPAYQGGPEPQAYDAGPAGNGYGYQGSAYASRGGSSYSSSSRSSYSSGSVAEYGYDSGWRRVEGAVPPQGYGEHHYGSVSVQSGEYDSGWRVREGRPEVWCPPGSRYDRPHPRFGCGVAEVGVAPSFFYDTGGVGPAFIGGGGGGGGGVVVIGGGGARSGAFASAHASASVRVGIHGGFHGRAGCGCHGGGRGKH